MNLLNFYNNYHKKNSYYSKIIDDNNFTYFYHLRAIRLLFNTTLKINANILDIGCGVGALSLYLAGRGAQVVGVDLSSDAIQIANNAKKQLKLNNVVFLRQSAEEFVKTNHKFDVIICSEVIEHIHEDKVFLKKLRKLLKAKGVLLLSTPSINAPLYRLGLLKKFDLKVGHLRRYDSNGLQLILKSCGFLPIHISKNESVLRNLLFTYRPFGFLIKLIKGQLVQAFHDLDERFSRYFGESDILIIAKKN